MFTERCVEVDSFRIRYMEAGSGRPVVALHHAGALELSRAHELLAERYRVIAFEVPESAQTVLNAIRVIGLDSFNLWSVSSGTPLALWVAMAAPDAVEALVLEAPRHPEAEDELGRINIPTLVVFGTRDTMVPPETGRIYRHRLPNCHYVLVYDAGHAVGAERPEAFTQLVSDFLERREAFIVSERSSRLYP